MGESRSEESESTDKTNYDVSHQLRGELDDYMLPEGEKVGVSYLAILLSKKYVDYRALAIPSPFEEYASFGDLWKNKPLDVPWNTLLVPIVQRAKE